MDLDDPGGQLEQGGGVEVHLSHEPDDQRVVSERELVEAAQENEAVREDGQAVGVKVQDLQLLQLANAIWKMPVT